MSKTDWIQWGGGKALPVGGLNHNFTTFDVEMADGRVLQDIAADEVDWERKPGVVSGVLRYRPSSWRSATPSAIDKALQSARDTQVAGDHYKKMGVEPWDVVDTWPLEQRIGAYRHGALKYLMRMGSKDQSAQEIAKGKHYMEKLLEVLNEPSTR